MKNNEKNNRVRKICVAAMFAAICAAATMIHVPISATGGYMNLGDVIVLLSGWLLGPVYGFAAAGIGSALTDLFLGYTTYVPVTFIVKGLMAVAAFFIYKAFGKDNFAARAVSALVAEIIMVGGYYLCESTFLGYGFIGALGSIPGNTIQAVGGLVIACAIYLPIKTAFVKAGSAFKN